MADKNHEQYLEQIETAVAETTKSLMEDNQSDFLRVARMVAEKQVEIDRLKEHQKNDRKTIRDLRGHLKELAEEGVAEVTELKKELEKRNYWAISTLQATGEWSAEEAEEQGLCPFNILTGRLVNTTHELKTAKSILSTNLEGRIEAYETMTDVKRDVIIRHADPTNDEYYTYKSCDEYEEELGELEEWKAIHPEWAPSGDLTPSFISECLDDQYENIKQLKEEKEALEEEVEELKSDLDGATEVNDELKAENKKLKMEKNPVIITITDTSMEEECKGLREEGMTLLQENKELKKQRETSTQIAIRLEAATSRLDEEGWEWNEEKQDYVED